jgi:hypothetical protein
MMIANSGTGALKFYSGLTPWDAYQDDAGRSIQTTPAQRTALSSTNSYMHNLVHSKVWVE